MKISTITKIASVVTGAGILSMGFAFAGGISFQNVPIVNNAGVPVVQIVLGSQSKPSDGLVAGNIAAAIGNLAYTSVPVTASVNATQAAKVLKVVGSSSSYTLKNPEVWLAENSTTTVAGAYTFTTLIGSVLNDAVLLNSPQNTKTLQGDSGSQYAYQQSTSIDQSPAASPYTATSYVPISSTVTATSNGGGSQFTSFTKGSSTRYDNIMQLGSTQIPGLLSNWGGHGESEYLWLSGFPVFNQGASGSPVNQFQVDDVGGAYQIVFNNPIQNTTTSSGTQINVPIRLLGQNWTIIRAIGAGTQSSPTSTTTVTGGKLELASSLSQTVTINVGKNYSIGAWNIALQDLGQPNSNGTSSASISVYYNNVLTNVSAIQPLKTQEFNVSGHTLFVSLNQTFAGLYAYQKWAKFGLYTSLYNITNGKQFNTTSNPGWYTTLLWTNTTGGSNAVALESIVLYNSTPTTLTKGQSFSFIQNPSDYKLTFLGDTLNAGSYDQLSLQTSSQGTLQYQNLGSTASPGLDITNITEPVSTLMVSSQIPDAFSFTGQTGSSVTYDLTPYQLNEEGNAVVPSPAISNVNLNYGNVNPTAWVSGTYPLLVTVSGFLTSTASTQISETVSFTSPVSSQTLPTPLFNVTNIRLGQALPGAVTVNVVDGNTLLATLANTISPALLWQQSGKQYESLALASAGSVIYNQQDGTPTSAFNLQTSAKPTTTGIGQYFTYTMNEIGIPSTATQDGFTIGIDNNSAGVVASPGFQLNYSLAGSPSASGSRNNVTYTSTGGSQFNVQQGFVSERGSKVVSLSPYSVDLALAKNQDMLRFAVGKNTSSSVTSKANVYGGYGIGAVTNLENVSVYNITANVTLGTKNYSISGISNLTATPSINTAIQPTLLKNLSTQPLVVLDSQANPNTNLILIGSGYVNILSQALQKQYNITVTNSTQIVQAEGTNRILIAGYTANQTTAAGNSFIEELYASASSSS